MLIDTLLISVQCSGSRAINCGEIVERDSLLGGRHLKDTTSSPFKTKPINVMHHTYQVCTSVQSERMGSKRQNSAMVENAMVLIN